MADISKKRAEAIAAKVSSDKYDKKIESLKHKIEKESYKCVIKKLGKNKPCQKDIDNGWVKTQKTITIDAVDQWFTFNVSPYPVKAFFSPVRLLDSDVPKMLKGHIEKYAALKEDKHDFEISLLQAILQLKTDKQVAENLPEIKKYLNQSKAVANEAVKKVKLKLKEK